MPILRVLRSGRKGEREAGNNNIHVQSMLIEIILPRQVGQQTEQDFERNTLYQAGSLAIEGRLN